MISLKSAAMGRSYACLIQSGFMRPANHVEKLVTESLRKMILFSILVLFKFTNWT